MLFSALLAATVLTGGSRMIEVDGKYHVWTDRAGRGQVYAQHLLRLKPWPEPVDRAFKKFNGKIYNIMQGPNEFVITGKLPPRSRVVLTKGSHFEMYDDQQTYFCELVKFIKDVEAGKM
jgi:hypothetical protein